MSHDATALTKRGSEDVIAYACGKCGSIVGNAHSLETALELATKHCGPWSCTKCGVLHDRSYQSTCQACWRVVADEYFRACEEAKFDKRDKIAEADWDGPVWDPTTDEGHESVDELRAAYLDDTNKVAEWPKWVWGGMPDPIKLDAGDIVERFTEGKHESYEDAFSAAQLDELQELLDGWCEKHDPGMWTAERGPGVVLAPLLGGERRDHPDRTATALTWVAFWDASAWVAGTIGYNAVAQGQDLPDAIVSLTAILQAQCRSDLDEMIEPFGIDHLGKLPLPQFKEVGIGERRAEAVPEGPPDPRRRYTGVAVVRWPTDVSAPESEAACPTT